MLNLEDSIEGVRLIENLQLNKPLLSSLSNLFPNENWKFVNDFQVLKNMASLTKGGMLTAIVNTHFPTSIKI